MKPTKALAVIGSVFTTAGMICLVVSALLGLRTQRFIESAVSASGEVIALNRSDSSDSIYTIIIRVSNSKITSSYLLVIFVV